jgi:hypothetical protein
MQIKKILGVLLAFCFLMSVTAAAVSAEPVNPVIKENKNIGQKDDRKIGDKDDRDKMKRGHFEKGHFEWKLVKEFKKIRGHFVVVKVWKKIWIAPHWVFNFR